MAIDRQEILQIIRNEDSLEGFDLSEANLEGADLRGVNLKKTNLSGANLGNARLEGADLTGANCHRANFQYANLDMAILTDCDMTESRLHSVEAAKADLSGVDLKDAVLTQADFFQVSFRNASLEGAKIRLVLFDRVDATGANFTGADLTESTFREANLTSAKFHQTRLQESLLVMSDLTKTEFQESDLARSSFRRCKMTATSFLHSRLNECAFSQISMEDLKSCDFEGTSGFKMPTEGEDDDTEVIRKQRVARLTIGLEEKRLTSMQMIRCLLFLEEILKTCVCVQEQIDPEFEDLTEDGLDLVKYESKPARLTLTSTDPNLVSIYCMILMKKAEMESLEEPRVLVGSGYSRIMGDQTSAVVAQARAEAMRVMDTRFPEDLQIHLLKEVPPELRVKYGGPLIPALQMISLRLSDGGRYELGAPEEQELAKST
ncbi:MAG: pentapeptide repeat-containing protein [Planctomycetota bacterium]|nr:pentapeptide repeat-containing protein [Planctomycetota bacterium]